MIDPLTVLMVTPRAKFFVNEVKNVFASRPLLNVRWPI